MRRQQPSNSECWPPSATSSGAGASGTARWPASRRRCATIPAPRCGRLDLADTYMSLRDYAEAERRFDRAIQLAPDWADELQPLTGFFDHRGVDLVGDGRDENVGRLHRLDELCFASSPCRRC